MSSLAINLKSVIHSYPTKAQPIEFNLAQWQVEQGQRVFLHGDSGSGKSTLLNLLSGILTAKSGVIEILGENLTEMSNAKRDKFRAKHIGVVFQTFNLVPYLSVLQNIQLAAHFAKSDSTSLEQKTKVLLDKLNLPLEVLGKPTSELSIGQQQRVAIVRALINEPELLLVDEPTSALDASARDAFMQVLMDVCLQTNTTLIFVSHDQSLKDYFELSVDVKSLFTAQEAS